MNAPFDLKPQQIPTTEREAFRAALAIAKRMGHQPSLGMVRAWAAKMKEALRGG